MSNILSRLQTSVLLCRIFYLCYRRVYYYDEYSIYVTDECTIRTNSPKFPQESDHCCGQCTKNENVAAAKKKGIL